MKHPHPDLPPQSVFQLQISVDSVLTWYKFVLMSPPLLRHQFGTFYDPQTTNSEFGFFSPPATGFILLLDLFIISRKKISRFLFSPPQSVLQRTETEHKSSCSTYRLGGFNEDLGPSELELILVHVDRAQEMKDPLFFISSPRRPGLFGQDGVPEED